MEAERKGLHYVESTCCYGAGASSPWPPMHSCIPACPPSCPDPHGAGMESWTGQCDQYGCFPPCTVPAAPADWFGGHPKPPHILKCNVGMWLPDPLATVICSQKTVGNIWVGSVGVGSASISWLGLGKASLTLAQHGVRGDSQLRLLNSPQNSQPWRQQGLRLGAPHFPHA